MPLRNRIKKFITGLSISQEYVCLDLARYQHPLSVHLSIPGTTAKIDVTNTHILLGYKPVIIAIPFSANNLEFNEVRNQNRIELSFKKNSRSKISVASIKLNKIAEKVLAGQVIMLFEVIIGSHSFLSSFHQFVNRLNERRRVSPSSNINLPGNLYDQVRIAYSIPRIISIITTTNGTLMNMFPTDLHGPIGDQFYCGSLRIGGKANDQVQNIKKIVLSNVAASTFKETYFMGKNHMIDLQRQETFRTSGGKSERFNFPLPENVVSYRELQQLDSLDHGIHRIHFYEVVNKKSESANSNLAHIHQYFAQWRLNNCLPTDLLLR